MQAAEIAARPAGRGAGRLQTALVIAVTAVLIGLATFVIGGAGDDGVTKVDLGSAAAANAPGVGGIPPSFTALTYDGKQVSLSDFKGKPLWLTFGASWCPDCRTEAADVEATYEANRGKGLALLAVFMNESAAEIGSYAQKAGLTFPIAVDQNADIAAAYRTMGIPTHFFIDAAGTVRLVRIGALSRDDMASAVASILN